MSGVMLGTNYVQADEPCWSLKEINERAPDSFSHRRYRVIIVYRDERFYEYRQDLGLAKDCELLEFFIPGGEMEHVRGLVRIYIEETVGRLLEIAERRHAGYEKPHEMPAPLDLVKGFQDAPDRRRRRQKAQSQFGPCATIQRS